MCDEGGVRKEEVCKIPSRIEKRNIYNWIKRQINITCEKYGVVAKTVLRGKFIVLNIRIRKQGKLLYKWTKHSKKVGEKKSKSKPKVTKRRKYLR